MGVYDRWTVQDGRLVSAPDCIVYSGGVDVDYSVGDCVGEDDKGLIGNAVRGYS